MQTGSRQKGVHAEKRPATLAGLRRQLAALGDPLAATALLRFFKTGPGEYGAGDCFRGIHVPALRTLAREHAGLPLTQVLRLLASRWHEDRLVALLILVRQFERGDASARARVYAAYGTQTGRINNWDLVDLSAPNIVGAWLLSRDEPKPLMRLAQSDVLWERRIAIVASHAFIRQRRFDVTLSLATHLLDDRHDLIHKATGWMLREVGKRDAAVLTGFLDRHAGRMPRTMLRYAIERFGPATRQRYLRSSPASQASN
jgi:3-methyladenine DNA glycosylase AlkD